MLKLLVAFMGVAACASPERVPAGAGADPGTTGAVHAASQSPELRSADDLLWLTGRDRQTVGAEYLQALRALDASAVPTAEKAQEIAIRFMLTHGGLRAEEGPRVVALLRIGRDLPPFASKGDLVWVVRISHLWLGVTQEMWIGSASGEVRAVLPADKR